MSTKIESILIYHYKASYCVYTSRRLLTLHSHEFLCQSRQVPTPLENGVDVTLVGSTERSITRLVMAGCALKEVDALHQNQVITGRPRVDLNIILHDSDESSSARIQIIEFTTSSVLPCFSSGISADVSGLVGYLMTLDCL